MTDLEGRLSSAARAGPGGELTQSALLFAPDGAAQTALVDPRAERRRRRDGMRGDARRTAEYLASRGKTPVEALHDIVLMGWIRAVRAFVRELHVSPERAMELYLQCVGMLLPYTAPRHETLELGPNAAGGMALGHFLAAQAMGNLLAAERSPAMSRKGLSLDGTQALDLASENSAVPTESRHIARDPDLLTLPPRGTD